MISTTILVLFLHLSVTLCSAQNKYSESSSITLKNVDIIWIKKILDNWELVCRKELKIKVEPLPWIIFYDSSHAWHLNADESLLPAFVKSPHRLLFAGRSYQLIKLSHSKEVWVPGRKSISVASYPTVAMPYADNRKVFFIAPLRSFFHSLSTPDQSEYLDFLFLGNNVHELVHTRQLVFTLPQLLYTQKAYKLPESIDDNTIENSFGKNENYRKLFFEEKTHFWNAVLTTNKDSCIIEMDKALSLAEQREKRFFARDSLGYARLDDIFISLEGSAMWAQYRIMVRNAPRGQTEKQTLFWLLQRTPTWSQEEGLALFLLLERVLPDWKAQFFEKELPSVFQLLKRVVAKSKKTS